MKKCFCSILLAGLMILVVSFTGCFSHNTASTNSDTAGTSKNNGKAKRDVLSGTNWVNSEFKDATGKYLWITFRDDGTYSMTEIWSTKIEFGDYIEWNYSFESFHPYSVNGNTITLCNMNLVADQSTYSTIADPEMKFELKKKSFVLDFSNYGEGKWTCSRTDKTREEFVASLRK